MGGGGRKKEEEGNFFERSVGLRRKRNCFSPHSKGRGGGNSFFLIIGHVERKRLACTYQGERETLFPFQRLGGRGLLIKRAAGFGRKEDANFFGYGGKRRGRTGHVNSCACAGGGLFFWGSK